MDPHQALGHAEAAGDPVIPCGLCRKPWEAYATDDDGVKLCRLCSENDTGYYGPERCTVDPSHTCSACAMPPKDAAMLRAWQFLRSASAFQKLDGLPGAKDAVSAARVVLRQAMGSSAYAATVDIENRRGSFIDDVRIAELFKTGGIPDDVSG